MEKIYIETTVVSYLTAFPSRDIIVLGKQEITHETWPLIADRFEPFISALVLQEISKGDANAASKRLDAVKNLALLGITAEAESAAALLLDKRAVPAEFPEDALHIAIAAVNGMEYLLTWNFSHINNAFTANMIRRTVEAAGYSCPVICSPEELITG